MATAPYIYTVVVFVTEHQNHQLRHMDAFGTPDNVRAKAERFFAVPGVTVVDVIQGAFYNLQDAQAAR